MWNSTKAASMVCSSALTTLTISPLTAELSCLLRLPPAQQRLSHGPGHQTLVQYGVSSKHSLASRGCISLIYPLSVSPVTRRAAAVQVCLSAATSARSAAANTQSYPSSAKCAVRLTSWSQNIVISQQILHSQRTHKPWQTFVWSVLSKVWPWCWPPIWPDPSTTCSRCKSSQKPR